MKRLLYILLFIGSLAKGQDFSARVNAVGITSAGTITSGVWNGTAILGQYGGTGVANTGKTITLGGNFVTSGAFATTLTSTATTNATLPAGTNTLYSTLSGSITSSQLLTSLTDETGTGTAVFSASPTFTGTVTIPTLKSAASGSASNIYIATSDGSTIGESAATLQFAGSTTITYRFNERGAFNTTSGVGDAYTSHIIGTQTTTEAASGVHPFMAQLVINPLLVTNGTATTTDAATLYVNGPMTGITPTARNDAFRVNGTSYFISKSSYDATITAGGTTGNQTINKPTGTVNIAAAGTTVTVTNSLCTTSSIVYAVIRTNDATATIKNIVPGSGSFVITLNAAATSEVSIGFIVFN